MAFQAKGRRAYKARVRHPDGRTKVCGCDTFTRSVADAMERWARGLRKGSERRVDVLDAILDGKVTLPKAYDARGDLDGLMAQLADVNIALELDAWERYKSGAKKGSGSAEKYRAQVETLLIPGEPFYRSQFTAKRIRKHLASLDCDDATRNRYKAAFSSFARYLVDHDVLERNIVRDIPGWPAGPSREVWYELADAKKIVEALPQPYRAIEALMCTACLEWQAIERLTLADVDIVRGTVRARGSKTAWRNRTCKVLADLFPWAWEAITPALGDKLPGALLFPGIKERHALAVHHATVLALNLPDSTLHDWRHTHLVHALKAGYPPIPLARQAGHKDAHLLWVVYGKHIPHLDELAPRQLPEATSDASKLLEARAAK